MKKRILIVDDDTILNQLNKKIFIAAGIVESLDIAHNGKEALGLFESCFGIKAAYPQIILVDIDMPVMNGIAFVEAFQKLDFPEKEQITLIVFSGSLNPKQKQRMQILGVKYFLDKPYILRGLKAIINTINTSVKGAPSLVIRRDRL